jgi:hypothetical protein
LAERIWVKSLSSTSKRGRHYQTFVQSKPASRYRGQAAKSTLLAAMSDNLFQSHSDSQETGISEQRHGQSVLTLVDGQPYSATGCLLFDDQVTDALCLAALGDEQVWARPFGQDKRLRRRGRVLVEPGIALRFVDEPTADVSTGLMIARPSLERDLVMSAHIRTCVQSKLFALLLYIALCGIEWWHRESGETWSSSMRGAEEVIRLLRGEAGFYSWYLFEYGRTLDSEFVDEVVLAEIEALGWAPAP